MLISEITGVFLILHFGATTAPLEFTTIQALGQIFNTDIVLSLEDEFSKFSY